MLIGLCGGICAGKHSVAEYLIKEHSFSPVSIKPPVFLNGHGSTHKRAISIEGFNSLSLQGESFDNVESLLDFVTRHWHTRWVIADVRDEKTVEALIHRPFFMLVSVDAPVSVRWNRYRTSSNRPPETPATLEQFVIQNDDHLYNPVTGLARLADRATVKLLNSSTSLSALHQSLDALDLPNEQRLRPSWDQYFMELASLAAQRSNCMRRRVGCVLVREKRVISTGYNGTPRNITNCNAGGCPRCNAGQGGGVSLSTCLCIHAEENALLEAGRERIREGSILYCDTCPCLTCSIKITQVGISEVVYSQSYYMDSATAALFKEAGVRLRQFSPPRKGVIDLALDAECGVPTLKAGDSFSE